MGWPSPGQVVALFRATTLSIRQFEGHPIPHPFGQPNFGFQLRCGQPAPAEQGEDDG
jgi:hypothetical protein